VNKSQLIDTIAERLELGRRQAVETVEAVFETIQQAVVNGERVVISGFGVFEKVQRAARLGRNPATGEPVPVQETVVPKFRPGTEFKAYVSGAKDMAQTAVASARERVERTVQAAADQINWPMGGEGEDGAERPDGAAATGTAAKTAKPASAPRASTRAPGSKTTRSTATKAASTRGATRTSGTARRTAAAGEKATSRRTSTTGTAKTAGARATGTRAAGTRSTVAKADEPATDAKPDNAPGASNDGSSSG
jgi:DNA-binding protein HU-beta